MFATLLALGVFAQTIDKESFLVVTTSNFTHSTLTPDGGDGESILCLNEQYGYFFCWQYMWWVRS